MSTNSAAASPVSFNPFDASSADFDPRTGGASSQGTLYRRAPHWFALFATAFTWPLLFLGGLVTSFKVGMAVPDWPTTFGVNMFLYDMRRVGWAVFGEHSHRLYGSAVGLATILLMLDFFLFDRRRWIKVLGVVALLGVIAQGLLGGFRVRLNSEALAALHGATGQLFFALMVALCVWTSHSWQAERRSVAGAAKVARMSWVFLGLVYGQVLVGAWVRHYSRAEAVGLHAGLAVAVLGHGLATVAKVVRRRGDWPELVPSAWVMGLALLIQISLGVAAWWVTVPVEAMVGGRVPFWPAIVRTAHQANAALLIAATVVLALRAQQLSERNRATERPASVPPVRTLEAVA